MARIWSYPGGKSRVAKAIVDRLSPWLDGARAYYEPYVGGGAVAIEVAARYPDIHVYVNDLDEGVAEVWRRVSSGDLAPLERRLWLTHPETVEEFEHVRDASVEGEDPLYLAVRSIYLSKASFSGLGVTPIGGYAQKSKWPVDFKWNQRGILREIQRLSGMLRGRLHVTSEDAVEVVGSLRVRDVAYLDPPYYSAPAATYYGATMSADDHVVLARSLRRARCRWALSYDDVGTVRSLYEWATLERLGVPYSMAPRNVEHRRRDELLILSAPCFTDQRL